MSKSPARLRPAPESTPLHDEAPRVEDTDWPQIQALYGVLMRMSDNPMAAMNHAIAAAMVHGPTKGLELLAPLEKDERLRGNHRLDAVRAHLFERAGERDVAVKLVSVRGHEDEQPSGKELSDVEGGALARWKAGREFDSWRFGGNVFAGRAHPRRFARNQCGLTSCFKHRKSGRNRRRLGCGPAKRSALRLWRNKAMTSLDRVFVMTATAAALALGAVAHAGPVLNGPVLNGPVLNGPVLNGPVLNGPVLNGPVLNGPVLNGPVLNGPVLNGPVLNTSLLQALRLQPVSIPRIATGQPVAVTLPSGETIAVR